MGSLTTQQAREISTGVNEIRSTPIGQGPFPGGRSVAKTSELSQQERIFCEAFVTMRGRGDLAAIEAGFNTKNASLTACRLLVKDRIASRIQVIVKRLAHTGMPAAIAALIDICNDPTVSPASRIKAANSLLERGGLATDKGGVQVNVGVQMNGGQVQQLIGSVWDAKQARLSGIPPAMSDSIAALNDEVDAIEATALEVPAEDPGGGMKIEGPSPESCPIAGYSSATPSPTDEFMEVFRKGTSDY